MTIQGNAYTVEHIDQAVGRTKAALAELPDGAVNPATIYLLMELYLGAIDADKPQAKSAGGGQ